MTTNHDQLLQPQFGLSSDEMQLMLIQVHSMIEEGRSRDFIAGAISTYAPDAVETWLDLACFDWITQ